MASQRIKFTVGLFMTFGIGIAVLAVIWLGMSHYFEKGQKYATYFNESVQGLDKDSPVKYRGVSIGRVESIGVAPDSKLVQVILKIETGQKLDKNIVAQLSSVGITGSMFIELDQKKKDEPDRSPLLTFPSEYPIISSKPSNINEFLQGIDDVFTQIRSLDLGGISEKIKLTLDNLNQAVADANVKGFSNNIEASLADIKEIVDRHKWDKIITSVENIMKKADSTLSSADSAITQLERISSGKRETIEGAIENFKNAMEKANIFLEKGTMLVSGTDDSLSFLKQYLLTIARNLEQASENLNRVSETIADQPSQLLFGEPPVPRKVED